LHFEISFLRAFQRMCNSISVIINNKTDPRLIISSAIRDMGIKQIVKKTSLIFFLSHLHWPTDHKALFNPGCWFNFTTSSRSM